MRAFMESKSLPAAANMDAARESSAAAPAAASGAVVEDLGTSSRDELLIKEEDRRRKNVDSGKVAIVYCTDSISSFKDKWSGTSKERRRSVHSWPRSGVPLSRRSRPVLLSPSSVSCAPLDV